MTDKQFLNVEKGKEVATVYHEADSNKWIFFCHGFGSDKEGSYTSRCERAAKEGYNAVRFDFRGNGESDGEFIEQTLSSKIKDLKTVINHFKPENYVLFGSSFGGKVVLESTEELDPEALIGRAPVTYNSIMDKYRAVVEEKGSFTHHEGATIDKRFYNDLDQYSFDQTAEKLDLPILIVHGEDDSTVHFENSQKAQKSIETDVLLQKLKEEKHLFSDDAEDKMLELMFNWLKTV